ncbi:MAG TPA: BON domain-containing protein [Candidatus Acidoferrum sp.]|nr:BON domain-containing protein [Candidatus Acidoferrum sp.]
MRERSILSVAVLAVALATGCAKKQDDTSIVTNVQSQMFADPQLKDASIQVSSNKGEVTLSGTVSSDAAHLDAYKIASQTPGVTKVDDQIVVQAAQATSPTPPPAAKPEPKPSHEKHPRKDHAAEENAESAQNVQPPATAATPEPAPPPAPEPTAAPAPAPLPPPPPPPREVEVPAGTTITVRMIDGVDSSVNNPGEIFHASLENPIVLDNEVVVPKGADVYVRLAAANSAGKFSGKSELHLELIKLESRGRSYSLVSSTYSLSGSSRGKDTATKVGGGAVLGAIVGAIAGGGKGAAIGATVGGAGGGVYQAATHGKQVRIPSETKLDFQLEQPFTATVTQRPTPLND